MTDHDPRAADAPIDRWDRYDETPPWAEGDTPDVDRYMESEQFVAGAISTLPPFNHFHPAWALPIARQALDALSEWEPTDDRP